MNEYELNKGLLENFISSEGFEEKFRLPLTARHQLVVTHWQNSEHWGVDLRRWSYDQSRLLLQGITLSSSGWNWLCEALSSLVRKGAFAYHGAISAEEYVVSKKLNSSHELRTCVFDEGQTPYFCVNLTNGNSPVWRAKGTIVGCMIRFNTIPDFLERAREHGLAKVEAVSSTTEKVDPVSGRRIL